jgi:hypothetical protein
MIEPVLDVVELGKDPVPVQKGLQVPLTREE